MDSNHVRPLTAPYFPAAGLHMRDMYKLRRSRSREQQHNRSLTDTPSLLLCTHPRLPLLWSFSEDLFPAQWHVDVYNGDGWWLALPHRGTDGLLPKRLSASLHQSLSDSPSRNRARAQYWPCSGVCWRMCVGVCVASTTCY